LTGKAVSIYKEVASDRVAAWNDPPEIHHRSQTIELLAKVKKLIPEADDSTINALRSSFGISRSARSLRRCRYRSEKRRGWNSPGAKHAARDARISRLWRRRESIDEFKGCGLGESLEGRRRGELRPTTKESGAHGCESAYLVRAHPDARERTNRSAGRCSPHCRLKFTGFD
jgi:hypothetical protein